MAELILRNLDEDLTGRLERRASRHGRSMEDEARDILQDILEEQEEPRIGLGSRIAARFAGIGFDFEVQELRGHLVQPIVFDD